MADRPRRVRACKCDPLGPWCMPDMNIGGRMYS